MRKVLVLVLAIIVAASAKSVCTALWEISNTGNWPESWPIELEQLRAQSHTLYHTTATIVPDSVYRPGTV